MSIISNLVPVADPQKDAAAIQPVVDETTAKVTGEVHADFTTALQAFQSELQVINGKLERVTAAAETLVKLAPALLDGYTITISITKNKETL